MAQVKKVDKPVDTEVGNGENRDQKGKKKEKVAFWDPKQTPSLNTSQTPIMTPIKTPIKTSIEPPIKTPTPDAKGETTYTFDELTRNSEGLTEAMPEVAMEGKLGVEEVESHALEMVYFDDDDDVSMAEEDEEVEKDVEDEKDEEGERDEEEKREARAIGETAAAPALPPSPTPPLPELKRTAMPPKALPPKVQ